MALSDLKWHQLTLPIFSLEENTFENFYSRSNTALLACLRALVLEGKFEKGFPYTYLWGHTGSGCSHLLQACCHLAQACGARAAYISLDQYQKTQDPQSVQALVEMYDLVCLDKLASVARNRVWEEALFYVYNYLLERGVPLIVAGSAVPQQLNLSLPDLVSRLGSGILFQVQSLTDSEKLAALQLRAQLRGFHLSQSVGEFLLSRLSRHPTALFAALDRLDEHMLSHRRKLTIPLVKEALSL